MRTNVIALNFIRCYHPITVLLIFVNVFYLEKNVLSCVIFHLKLLYLYDFLAYKYKLKYTVSYSGLFMLYDLPDKMWALFCQFSSTDLIKLERLIKFNNEPEVPFGQSLEPKPPQSEPQLQRHKLLKRHQQVSKCNGCGTLTNPTKNYIF